MDQVRSEVETEVKEQDVPACTCHDEDGVVIPCACKATEAPVEATDKSALLEHAYRELALVGYKPLTEEQEDGPDKWIQENVLELLNTFRKQGHSGSSASYCINLFNKLANFEPLTPLKLTLDEFVTVEAESQGTSMMQNKRDNRVFAIGPELKPKFLHAIVWRNYETNEHFTGTATLPTTEVAIDSAQPLKGPCIPQSFVVPVFFNAEKNAYTIMDTSVLEQVEQSGLYNFTLPNLKEFTDGEETKVEADKE